jgi:hypothetical protein
VIRPGRNVDPRVVDARSLANTIRLISAEPSKASVLASSAVFVTTNVDLVERGIKYFREAQSLHEQQAPPFLTDRQLAGLLWLAVGGAGNEVPRRKLLAACTAAMTPQRDS